MTAEGFSGVEVANPGCDVSSSGPPCSFYATKDELRIEVGIYRPGDNVDQLGLATGDQATVRMIVRRK